MYVLLGLIIFLICLFNHYRSHQIIKSPPGPWSWPLVGHYFSLQSNVYEYSMQLSKKYGPIIRLRFGLSNVIVLNDLDLIKRALSNSSLASRPDWASMTLQSEFPASFAFRPNGERWKLLRKNAVKALAMIKTHASTNIDQHYQPAFERLINDLTHNSNNNGWTAPIDPSKALFRCVITIIGQICFGPCFDPDDPELLSILESLQNTSRLTRIGSFLDCFPWCLFLLKNQIQRMRKDNKICEEYVVEKSNRSLALSEELMDEEVHDLNGALNAIADGKHGDQSKLSHEERNLIRYITVDLFSAGFFTTLTNLEWAFLLLATHSDVKHKMRQEITNICCDQKSVSLDDRQKMVYTEATILEIMRFATVLPFGIPHCTSDIVQIDQFKIDRNTPVLCNMWAVHHDSSTFVNPYKFDPDRFLITTNEGLKLNQALAARVIPFSTGVRRCPGESLAKQNLFLILCNVVKNLDFKLVTQYGDLNQCKCDFSRKPLPYELTFCCLTSS